MTAILKHMAAAVTATLLLPSCDKSPVGTGGSAPEPITLAAPVMQGMTKGIDPLQDSNLQNFGISAILDYDVSVENRWFLREQSVVKGSGARQWEITPTVYWPISGDLSFFFHAPSNIGHPEVRYIETSSGFPKVEFTPSVTDIAGQIDFCVGKPVLHCTGDGGSVPVILEHTLTQIMFYANYTGELHDGCTLKIDRVRIGNVVGTKTVTYTTEAPWYEWEDETTHQADSSYLLTRGSSHITNVDIGKSTGSTPDTYLQLSNSPGRLYLLPQTLGPDAKLVVEYGFYFEGGTKVMAMFAKEISLAGQVWPAGKTVNYQLTIDIGVSSQLSLSCNITDWVSSGNNHPEHEIK